DSVFIGEIIYTDDPIDDPSGWPIVIFTSCMTKRKCFEHEKELRALIWNTNEDIPREEDGSVKIPIQPRHLIENIYISPFADDSTVYEVQQIASKHQFEIVPIKSDLMDKPLY
ncbi:MAG: hypothetical protein JXA11_00020, partial [Phycisphaerae bacterium]|nr:hypothetical protein [Phycisphaerae bacterium]